MKLRITIDASGMETLARGGTLYSWHFPVQLPDAEGNFPNLTDTDRIVCPEVEVKLPSTIECAMLARTKLEKQIADVRANAYKEERELQTRINDLLMIGHEAPKETPAAAIEAADSSDDLPF